MINQFNIVEAYKKAHKMAIENGFEIVDASKMNLSYNIFIDKDGEIKLRCDTFDECIAFFVGYEVNK